MRWQCYIGEITEPYKERWEPHTVKPEQKAPDIYDAFYPTFMFHDRMPDFRAADKCFTDCIQVDWGGWAYKATVEQMQKYNEFTFPQDQISEDIIEQLDPETVYAFAAVELG